VPCGFEVDGVNEGVEVVDDIRGGDRHWRGSVGPTAIAGRRSASVEELQEDETDRIAPAQESIPVGMRTGS
jgi:hypothetical protein